MPFLSIIVPIYNVEKYISGCLDSILSQRFRDYELILVDDGSTDHCADICDTYAQKDNRIKVIHQRNRGLVGARKAGLESSVGSYIGFVDSDDYVDRDMFFNLCTEARLSAADIIICDYAAFTGDQVQKSSQQSIHAGRYNKTQMIQELYPYMLFNGHYYQFGCKPAVWNKIYKRDIIIRCERIVPDSVRIGEDAACTYPCLIEADSVSYLKGYCGYYYRSNPESMTHQKTETDVYSIVELLDFLNGQFRKYPQWGLENQLLYYGAWMYATIAAEYIQHGFIEKGIKRQKAIQAYAAIRQSTVGRACLQKYSKMKLLPKYHMILLFHIKYPGIVSCIRIGLFKVYGRVAVKFGRKVEY